MSKIRTKIEYDAIMERIEELCPLVKDDTPKNDRYLIELDLLISLIEEYEENFFMENSINQPKKDYHEPMHTTDLNTYLNTTKIYEVSFKSYLKRFVILFYKSLIK